MDRYRHSTLGSIIRGIIHNLNGSLQILSMQMEFLQGALVNEEEKISPSLNAKMDQCLEQMDKLKAMVCGAALVHDGRVLHLSAFRHNGRENDSNKVPFQRFTQRRKRR